MWIVFLVVLLLCIGFFLGFLSRSKDESWIIPVIILTTVSITGLIVCGIFAIITGGSVC